MKNFINSQEHEILDAKMHKSLYDFEQVVGGLTEKEKSFFMNAFMRGAQTLREIEHAGYMRNKSKAEMIYAQEQHLDDAEVKSQIHGS